MKLRIYCMLFVLFIGVVVDYVTTTQCPESTAFYEWCPKSMRG